MKEEESLALVPYSLNNPFGDVLTLANRIFSVATGDTTIDVHISQRYKPDGKGGTSIGFGASVYHCAVVLAKYLEENLAFHDLKNKQVLELGSGTGHLSVICSVLGAQFVLATDGDDVSVELSRQNFVANSAALSGSYQCSRLLWGNKDDICHVKSHFLNNKTTPDLIIAADVVAVPYATAYEDLVHTLAALSGAHTVVLLAYQRRHRDEDRFFEMLADYFEVTRLPRHSSVHRDFRQLPIFIYSLQKKVVPLNYKP